MNIHRHPVPLWIDQSIAERIVQLEAVLKFDPDPEYRKEAMREYLELVTDPDEAKPEPRK